MYNDNESHYGFLPKKWIAGGGLMNCDDDDIILSDCDEILSKIMKIWKKFINDEKEFSS
jgi:hypothetical protein